MVDSKVKIDGAVPDAHGFSKASILFIHYGAAHYLRWALAAARRSNPGKRIVLLGDAANRQSARGVAEFVDFESLGGTAKEQEFQRVFQVIQGERHRFNKANGVEFWLKFVFRRWFLIEAFLEKEGLESFWTFDTDTLVLADLAATEGRFRRFEAMSQCMNRCLNGWVGGRALVSRFTQSILDQFSDQPYLDSQRKRLKLHAGLSFNEMDAFSEFRSREGVNTCYGQVPMDGAIFDDALAFTEGFEVALGKVLGKTAVKRLWADGQNIYAKHLASGKFVRLLTCNMSWMPDFMWRKVMVAARCGGVEPAGICSAFHRRAGRVSSLQEYASHSTGKRVGGEPDISRLREISTHEPLGDWVLRKAKAFFWKVRSRI
jgi:hypothetical protein